MSIRCQTQEKTKQQFINAEQALSFSERYPYFHNYTQRDLGFIESNFDAHFAEILRGLSVSKTQWQGPIKSNLGYHAILLIGKEADKIKNFEDVKDMVKGDFRRNKENVLLNAKIQELKNHYAVTFIR